MVYKMSETCSELAAPKENLKSVGCPQDDVVKQREAHASGKAEKISNLTDGNVNIPQKKRKTRRGKSKRKQPYVRNRTSSGSNNIKAEAPYNSNQFLLDDHGSMDYLDENLKYPDRASTSINHRNRDSSFSVDSDGEFYSSPDDEEQFLIKDFDYQYETLHAERLNTMSKSDLIQEYLSLEEKIELLTNVLRKKGEFDKIELQMEIERLKNENESLKDQNFQLKSRTSKRSNYTSSSSSDSESDSSSSSSNQCDNSNTSLDL